MAEQAISDAMRILAGYPDHPATQRVLNASSTARLLSTTLLKPLFQEMRAIEIGYDLENYTNAGDLIIKRDANCSRWGVNRVDSGGDLMLLSADDEFQWGWAVRIDEFYLFSLGQALCHCFTYLNSLQANITRLVIRKTYYEE